PPAGSAPRSRRCPTAGPTSGWPGPPAKAHPDISRPQGSSPSVSVAISLTPTNLCTPTACPCTTAAPRSLSGRDAKSVNAPTARSVRSRNSAARSPSTRTAPPIFRTCPHGGVHRAEPASACHRSGLASRVMVTDAADRAGPDFQILVIGAGQSGLSAGYHLQRRGLVPGRDFLIVDHAPGPGGAWQFRWPSLTLSTVNGVHDLPGMPFADNLPPGATMTSDVPAATAVPYYYRRYEERFDLRVHRPVTVRVVCDRRERDGLLHAETDTAGTLRVRGLINGTG